MLERKRIHEQYLAHLISNSQAKTLTEFCSAKNINCYAAARLLTYPDSHRIFYSPGMIYNLKFGSGDFVKKELSPRFIHECIMRDNKVLNQKCTRVHFDEIKPNDGYHYFGITKYHLCPSKVTEPSFKKLFRNVNDEAAMGSSWHFIFRLSTGNWIHKPSWEHCLEPIKWTDYGKLFYFNVFNSTFGIEVPTEVTCFQDYFYRVEDLHLSIDV